LKTLLEPEEYDNLNVVKFITDLNDYALYFSRSLVPYPRKKTVNFKVYKHVGIYAYRRDFLLQYAVLAPTPLEQIESLEQLRVLENGFRIKVINSDFHGIGIDTKEDLEAVNKLFAQNK
ncbi:MAG: 3-deoxy-manno-octulosonate cytidylyltransferase, partial [Acidaminococcaceae bacterium]|nr:3-deoxy-manno-octulosonate cytidylyltransferase [Acidaminococcaceae bacterium]